MARSSSRGGSCAIRLHRCLLPVRASFIVQPSLCLCRSPPCSLRSGSPLAPDALDRLASRLLICSPTLIVQHAHRRLPTNPVDHSMLLSGVGGPCRFSSSMIAVGQAMGEGGDCPRRSAPVTRARVHRYPCDIARPRSNCARRRATARNTGSHVGRRRGSAGRWSRTRRPCRRICPNSSSTWVGSAHSQQRRNASVTAALQARWLGH